MARKPADRTIGRRREPGWRAPAHESAPQCSWRSSQGRCQLVGTTSPFMRGGTYFCDWHSEVQAGLVEDSLASFTLWLERGRADGALSRQFDRPVSQLWELVSGVDAW